MTDFRSKEAKRLEHKNTDLVAAWDDMRVFLRQRLREERAQRIPEGNGRYQIHGKSVYIPTGTTYFFQHCQLPANWKPFIDCRGQMFEMHLERLQKGALEKGIITGNNRCAEDKFFNALVDRITKGREKFMASGASAVAEIYR